MRCFSTFESSERLRFHVRTELCDVEEPRELEGINGQQKILLEQRVSSRKSMEENWYIVYDILFPGAARPRSPCESRYDPGYDCC